MLEKLDTQSGTLGGALEFCKKLSGKVAKKQKIDDPELASKVEGPVTVQDPCNIVRGRGLHEKLRWIMNELCEDFREVDPRFEHNYCCNAGGGLINCGPPWKQSRMLSNRVKAEQLSDTGAEICITPCHNCFDQVNDLSEAYDLGVSAISLKEIIVESMVVPDCMKLDPKNKDRSDPLSV